MSKIEILVPFLVTSNYYKRQKTQTKSQKDTFDDLPRQNLTSPDVLTSAIGFAIVQCTSLTIFNTIRHCYPLIIRIIENNFNFIQGVFPSFANQQKPTKTNKNQQKGRF